MKERVKGIEPSYSAWEADVLPLNYTRHRTPTSADSQRVLSIATPASTEARLRLKDDLVPGRWIRNHRQRRVGTGWQQIDGRMPNLSHRDRQVGNVVP
jgi:hypothetical protein